MLWINTVNMVDTSLPPLQSTRLLDQLRERLRFMHYSLRTEQAYVYWVKAFVRFVGLKHPREVGFSELERFLIHLAVDRQVAPSTHKQALAAITFMYERVLGLEVPWLANIGRPKVVKRLPVVLSQQEVQQVLPALDAPHRLLGQLLYGTGLRLMEGLRLRVKDIDFDLRAIVVRKRSLNPTLSIKAVL
jgi:integrase